MKKYLVLCLTLISIFLTGCGSNNKGPITFRKEDGIDILYSGDKPAHGKISRVDHNGYSYKFRVKKGLYHGKYESYYPSSELHSTMIYKNGKREGICEEYYQTGELKSKSNYTNGELNGTYESYHRNGQISVKANYNNDELDGIYEQYSENGDLKIRNNYENGTYHGEQILIEFGFISRTPSYRRVSTYEHGKLIKQKRTIENDEITSILTFDFYKLERKSVTEVTTYYDNGNIKEVTYYDKDDIMTIKEEYPVERSSASKTTTFDVNGKVLSSR